MSWGTQRWIRRGDPVVASRLRASQSRWLALLLATLLAVVIEFPIVVGLLYLATREGPVEPTKVRFTEVSLVSPEQLARLERKDAEKPDAKKEAEKKKKKKKKKEEEEEEEKEDKLTGQVVDLTAPKDRRPPKDAKYLARFDSSVERETRKAGKPGDSKAARAVPRGQDETRRPEPDDSVARIESAELPEAQPPRPEPSEQPEPAPDVQPLPESQRSRLRLMDRKQLRLEPPRPGGEVRLPAHRPRAGSYQELLPSLVPGAQDGNRGSDDYLPNLPEGDSLALNAREFKYWSFFNRVRKDLKREWKPADRFRVRDPWGKVYGVSDRLTVVSVTLDSDGKLHDLQMVKGSGIDFLDDEAVSAFRRVQAFPNPPEGLVEEDGYIRFRFGFAVVRNASSYNLFRYDF